MSRVQFMSHVHCMYSSNSVFTTVLALYVILSWRDIMNISITSWLILLILIKILLLFIRRRVNVLTPVSFRVINVPEPSDAVKTPLLRLKFLSCKNFLNGLMYCLSPIIVKNTRVVKKLWKWPLHKKYFCSILCVGGSRPYFCLGFAFLNEFELTNEINN